MEVCFGFTTGD